MLTERLLEASLYFYLLAVFFLSRKLFEIRNLDLTTELSLYTPTLLLGQSLTFPSS